MKIAIFTDSFYPQVNGVSNTLEYLSKYLYKKQIEHIFFAPDYDLEQYENSKIPVMRFSGIKAPIYPQCRLVFPPYAKILETLTAFNPDVVHIATELGIGLCGLRAARELNLPIVMSYHTDFDKYLQFYNLNYLSKALWAYMKWFHSFAQVNLCPSFNTLYDVERHGLSKLDIWSRGIDLERFSPDHYAEGVRSRIGGCDKTVFLYVGRIAKEKGLDTLVESIRMVNKKYKDKILFAFTGAGPYLDELISLKIPNTVFTGEKHGKELAEIYASSDVFVFPSGTETFGNVLLEAMASGLPGICVNSGGVTDFAVHQENAFICDYQNAQSLAHGITEMLNSDLREKLRCGALETAKSKSWDSVFNSLMTHYTAAAQNRLIQIQNIAG